MWWTIHQENTGRVIYKKTQIEMTNNKNTSRQYLIRRDTEKRFFGRTPLRSPWCHEANNETGTPTKENFS